MARESKFAPVSPSGALLARLRSARGQVRVGRSPHPACGGGTHGGKGAGRSAVRSARAPRPRRARALSAGFGSCRFPSPRPGFAAAGAAGRRVLRAGLRVAGRAGRGRGAGGSRKRTQVRAGGSGPPQGAPRREGPAFTGPERPRLLGRLLLPQLGLLEGWPGLAAPPPALGLR